MPHSGRSNDACLRQRVPRVLASDEECSAEHFAPRSAELVFLESSGLRSFADFLRARSQEACQNAERDEQASLALHNVRSKIQQLENAGRKCAFVFVGSPTAGFVIRSDLLSRRLRSFHDVSEVHDLRNPGAWVESMVWKSGAEASNWTHIVDSAIGVAIFEDTTEAGLQAKISSLPHELNHRLAVPLTMPTPPVSKRVCVIGGGLSMAYRASLFAAAKNLLINLVVLDEPGHWLNSNSEACEAFIPLKMTVDDTFEDRVVVALRSYGKDFDGIVTMSDRWLSATSHIARKLGLPTQPSHALEICTEKEKFREAFPIMNSPSLYVTSMTDFHETASSLDQSYPLIVKPSAGACSVGVIRADCRTEAEHQVEKLLQTNSGVLLEKFINGPEVDLSVVLIDGKVAFCDIADEPPTTAETRPDTLHASFLESQMIWPSILPVPEQDMVRDLVYSALRQLGFTDGLFNVEARVADSKLEWTANRDGIMALTDTGRKAANGASAMLIEINPRILGYPGVVGIEEAYGIDYTALMLLLSVADRERAKLLSHPFRGQENVFVVVDWVSVERGGRFTGKAMYEELNTRRPDLTKWLAKHIVYFDDGDIVRSPVKGSSQWVAFHTVRSDLGREHALGVCRDIQAELRYSMEDA